MTLKIAVIVAVLGVLAPIQVVAQSNAATVIARFAGTWKEDPSQNTFGGGNPGLRFRRNATGGLEELRGPDVNPVAQPVVFDGKPVTIGSGRQIAWKQIDGNTFERAISDEGRLQTTRRLRIAPDGMTLTEETELQTTDGAKTVDTIVFRRSSTEKDGLVGTWKPESFHTTNPAQFRYEPAGTNALKVTHHDGVTYTLTLDGKPAPVTGGTVMPDTTYAAKQIDDRTIDVTVSRLGKPYSTVLHAVSGDGKTMTVTARSVANPGEKPGVSVRVKQ